MLWNWSKRPGAVPGCCSCSCLRGTISILLPCFVSAGQMFLFYMPQQYTRKKWLGVIACISLQASDCFTQVYGLQGTWHVFSKMMPALADSGWSEMVLPGLLKEIQKGLSVFLHCGWSELAVAKWVSEMSGRAALRRWDVWAQMRFVRMKLFLDLNLGQQVAGLCCIGLSTTSLLSQILLIFDFFFPSVNIIYKESWVFSTFCHSQA